MQLLDDLLDLVSAFSLSGFRWSLYGGRYLAEVVAFSRTVWVHSPPPGENGTLQHHSGSGSRGGRGFCQPNQVCVYVLSAKDLFLKERSGGIVREFRRFAIFNLEDQL